MKIVAKINAATAYVDGQSIQTFRSKLVAKMDQKKKVVKTKSHA